MRYLPLTIADREAMLADIGVGDIDDLFADIPEKARLKDLLDLPKAKGELEVGQTFVSESVLGTRFTARILEETRVGDHVAIVPEIEGSAWITGFQNFHFDPDDPCRFGI